MVPGHSTDPKERGSPTITPFGCIICLFWVALAQELADEQIEGLSHSHHKLLLPWGLVLPCSHLVAQVSPRWGTTRSSLAMVQWHDELLPRSFAGSHRCAWDMSQLSLVGPRWMIATGEPQVSPRAAGAVQGSRCPALHPCCHWCQSCFGFQIRQLCLSPHISKH